jgi:hypothetical protein
VNWNSNQAAEAVEARVCAQEREGRGGLLTLMLVVAALTALAVVLLLMSARPAGASSVGAPASVPATGLRACPCPHGVRGPCQWRLVSIEPPWSSCVPVSWRRR